MRGWTKEELVEEYTQVASEFLFGQIVHDIRNRLSSIHAYASLLQEDLQKPESFNLSNASDFISMILKYSEDIHSIIGCRARLST